MFLKSSSGTDRIDVYKRQTQALQPLDRAFFKPFKNHYKWETNQWVVHNPKMLIKRLHAAMLISNAWGKSASVENCLSSFKATGIFPLNRNAIPDNFFNISDISQSDRVETVRESDMPSSDPSTVPAQQTAYLLTLLLAALTTILMVLLCSIHLIKLLQKLILLHPKFFIT